jgi:uncharacterized protein (DUF1499 family)
MAEALRRRIWAERLVKAAVVLSLGAVVVSLIAAIGSGQGWWHFRDAFLILRLAFFAAAAAVLLSIGAMVIARRSGLGSLAMINVVALVVALAFLLYLGNQYRTVRSVPAIHDVTTNLDDVPKFYRLVVRSDNRDFVPTADPAIAGLSRMEPEDRWKAIHAQHYGDLRTIRMPGTVADAIQKAEQLARDKGWEIVTADPRMGILEAVDTSTFFRFKDNVLIRARPAPGGGSLVDMRSISRVGVSDVGVNAKRVRSFLADLQQA